MRINNRTAATGDASESNVAPGSPPSAAPPRTDALAGARFSLSLQPPVEPIHSLRRFGVEREWPLPNQISATIGTWACDVTIEDVGVSRRHATLQRSGESLLIVDNDSRNGTFGSARERRSQSFMLEAGRSFWVARVQLLPMNAPLSELRSVLAVLIGLDAHRAHQIDTAIEAFAGRRPLAIVGERGTGVETLVEALHRASASPAHEVQRVDGDTLAKMITDQRLGTVCVDLEQTRTLPAELLSFLFSSACSLRVIFTSREDRTVRRHFRRHAVAPEQIVLTPLRKRRQDILPLLQRSWDQLSPPRKVTELANIEGIESHRWQGNLDALHASASRLLAYLEHGSLRMAASKVGITPQALGAFFRSIGFRPSHKES